MPRTTIAPLTFAVVYFTQCNAPIRVGKIEARDYWTACRIACHRSWKTTNAINRLYRNRKNAGLVAMKDAGLGRTPRMPPRSSKAHRREA